VFVLRKVGLLFLEQLRLQLSSVRMGWKPFFWHTHAELKERRVSPARGTSSRLR